MLNIRRFQEEDYEQVKEIIQACDLWDNSMNDSVMFSESLVAEIEGRIAGFLFCIIGPKIALCDYVCVHPDYRGLWVAPTLCAYAAETLKKAGFGIITYVDEAQIKSQKMAVRCGLKSAGKAIRFYGGTCNG